MTSKSKVLVIALDAATRGLIRDWADAGSLPTFKRMMAEGAWGGIEDQLEWCLGGLWGGFFTGLGPNNHRFSEIDLFDPDSYGFTDINATKMRGTPFWHALSDAGHRVAAIDLPRMTPIEGLNGIQIIDWGAHDPYEYQFRTRPESLEAEIKERFGIDPVGNCDVFMERKGDYDFLVEQLLGRVATKTALSKHYLEQGGWDLFVTSYSEPHCVGHQCWHVHDKAHFLHDATLVESLGDPVQRVYQAIDAGIAELIAAAGQDTTVIVLTVQGMGPQHDATYLLDEVLRRIEGAGNARYQVMRAAWRRLPHPLREFLRPGIASTRDRMQSDDRRFRRYFQVQTNVFVAGLRINLVGREKNGMVQPGADCDRLKAMLTEELKALRNADTGSPVVTKVMDMDQAVRRENIDGFPDLLIMWNKDDPILGVTSPSIGEVRMKYDYLRTGDHTFGGLFCAQGPHITAGEAANPVTARDFAPTMGALLETPLPGLDGQPIAAICGAKAAVSA